MMGGLRQGQILRFASEQHLLWVAYSSESSKLENNVAELWGVRARIIGC